MATSVHIPKGVLEAVDRKARALRISRNRFIIRALEHEISNETGWREGFFEILQESDPVLSSAVDKMLSSIQKNRSSKAPPK